MISEYNLSQRLAVPETTDELQRLSETLNEMIGRLESAFKRITQFQPTPLTSCERRLL
jgi:hypothetical protein